MDDADKRRLEPEYTRARLEFEEARAMGMPVDVREFAARHGDLEPLLLRDLIVADFGWHWRTGGDLPVEKVLGRHPEFRDDAGVVMGLIAVEIEHAPNEPDEPAYLERFPALAEEIRLHFEAMRSLQIKWTTLSTASRLPHDPGLFLAPPTPAEPGQWRPVAAGETIEFSDLYRVDDRRGEGGVKFVFNAFQVSTHRRVALKVPKDAARAQSMLDEARIQAQLDHPNIPPIVVLGPDAGAPTILIEKLVDGEEWATILDRQRAAVAASPPEARDGLRRSHLADNLEVLLKISDALRYCHEKLEVIHRDIKPKNVMVGRFGEVYLIDWGFALHVADQPDADVRAPHKSQSRNNGGTAPYMAPEIAQATIDRCSPRTDVFLLGATLYELLTDTPPYGTYPFPQNHYRALLGHIDPPEHRAPGRDMPAELAHIALTAMAVDPADRYADAAAFAAALGAYRRHVQAEELGRHAAATLERVRQELAQPDVSRRSLHSTITPLIEAADEFHQAGLAWRADRESSAGSGGAASFEEAGSQRMLQGERDTRWQLVELAERTGDFALAESQLDRIEAMSEAVGAGVAERRRRVRQQGARRRRTRVALWGATAVALLLFGVSLVLYANFAQERARVQIADIDRDTAKRVLIAEKKRATTLEALTTTLEALTKSERLRAAEQGRITQAQQLLIGRSELASDEKFQQGAARYLADALVLREDPRLRSWWSEALQRSLVPIQATSRRLLIGCLTYSPDGKFLVSGDFQSEPAIRIWRVDDGVQVQVLRGHNDPDTPQGLSAIRRVIFRPDRPTELISVGLDGTIRCWDLTVAEERARFPAAGDRPLPPVLTMDAAQVDGVCRVVTGDLSGKLTWWNLDDFRKITEADANKPKVIAARFRPDGRQTASVGEDGIVRLWDVDGRSLGELVPPDIKPGAEPIYLNDVAYSPDGKRLAVTREDGLILVWDVATRTLMQTLKGHEVGPDGRRWASRLDYYSPTRLFSTGADGTIREWNPSTGQAVAIRGRHDIDLFGQSGVRPLAMHPDGHHLASAGFDGTIRLWDLETGELTARLDGCQGGSIFSCTASASLGQKDLLITAGAARDAQVRSWDMATLKELRTYVEGEKLAGDGDPSPMPAVLAIHPRGDAFVTGLVGGDLIFWEIATGKRRATIPKAHTFPSHPEAASFPLKLAVLAVAWSRDGTRVASVGSDHLVKLWDPDTALEVAQWKDDDPEMPNTSRMPEIEPNTIALLFDTDGKHLVTAGRDGVIRVHEAVTGKVVNRLASHTRMVTVAVQNAEATLLATASVDGHVIVWDWAKRQPLRSFMVRPMMDWQRFGGPSVQSDPLTRPEMQLQFRMITGLAFSPDSRLLAIGQADSAVGLVELATGNFLHRGIGHEPSPPPWGSVTCHFTSDGLLVTAGSDGTIRRWDLLPQADGTTFLDKRRARRIAVSADGVEWAAVTSGHELVRWDYATGKEIGEWWPLENDQPNSVAYSPDNQRLVVGTFFGKGVVLDRVTGKTLAVFQAPQPPQPSECITTIAVDPTGTLAATNRGDDHVDLWRLDDGRPIKSLRTGGGRACRVAFRPEGPRQFAAIDDQGRLIVWDLDTFRLAFEVAVGPKPITLAGDLAYSPDGARLVQVGVGDEIAVWDPDSGRRVQSLTGHRSVATRLDTEITVIGGVSFSPDGRWMATCGDDGALWLWDASNKDAYQPVAVRSTIRTSSYRVQPNLNLPGLQEDHDPLSKTLISGKLRCLAFSADGRLLISSGWESPLRIDPVDAILADSRKPVAEILAETERLTGLRMKGTGLAPIERNHFVSMGGR